MAVDSVQERAAVQQWEDPDELDLTRYFAALARRWPEVLLVTLVVMALTAASVLIYRAVTPALYDAKATAAIVRVSTDVRLDERYTTSEQQNMDVSSRRTALIALVSSGAVAQQVIADLGDTLPPKLQDPAELLDVVEGKMAVADGGGQSDLINIVARAESPETAALIANAWATAYVQQVNRVYGQVPDEMLNTVQAQLGEAQQTYAAAQQRLEAHLSTSPLAALVRQSDAISQTLNTTQGSELRMVYDHWLRTSNLLTAARTLGEQINAGADADLGGLTLALQVLQVQVVNAATVLPAEPLRSASVLGGQSSQQPASILQLQLDGAAPASILQLQLDGAAPVSAAALRSQTAALIAALEGQLAQLEANFAAASQLLAGSGEAGSGTAAAGAGEESAPLANTTAQLESHLRALLGRIEVENARTLAFTEQRDLAWESVQALNNKQAELQLARAAANSEVRLSSTAVPLDKPVDQVSLVISLVLAALVGLLLGALVALGLEAANVPPLRLRRNAA